MEGSGLIEVLIAGVEGEPGSAIASTLYTHSELARETLHGGVVPTTLPLPTSQHIGDEPADEPVEEARLCQGKTKPLKA